MIENTRYNYRGGRSPNQRRYAMTYADTGVFASELSPYRSLEKKTWGELSRLAKAVVAYPARRSVNGVKLTDREYKYVRRLSCKSRAVFWLYYKFEMSANEVAELFGFGWIDQHLVYIRNKAIKRALFEIETDDKNIDWAEVRSMMDEGATESEIIEFYGITLPTLRRHTRD